ncbi:MAG: hypothetical protein ACTHOC_06000 [Luteimonas sp.]
MENGQRAGARPGRRARIAWTSVAIAAGVVLLLALAMHALREPQRASRFLLGRIGASLGLEIRAAGRAEYRLRGTPVLVLRDVSVREPGAARELLHAARILVSVPWSTIRARGDVLAAQRLELDAPQVDLPALQHWLATRPPSKQPQLPTFAEGVRIRDGRLANDDWTIDGIQVDLPRLVAGEPMHARLRARYLDPPLAIPADLAIAITDPAALLRDARTGFAASGRITVQRGSDWTLPGWIVLSGPLRFGADELRLQPARIGLAAQWESGAARVPFALGAEGPLLFDDAVWQLADAGIVLRGRGAAPASDPVPPLRARGQLALGRRLVLRLRGDIATWPAAWPALPAPLDAPSPMPFALDYTGAPDLGDVASLALRRGAASLDARFRLADVQDWLAADAADPLPPLDARVRAPLLEIAGARLEGVEATLDAPGVDDERR